MIRNCSSFTSTSIQRAKSCPDFQAVKVDRFRRFETFARRGGILMKRSLILSAFVAVLGLTLSANFASAEKAAAKSIAGKSSCATCDGVTTDGHAIMLVAEDGMRYILIADKKTPGYAEAHKARKGGKAMTATLAGEPVTKKDASGKEYKEVKVSEVKVG